MSYGIEIKNSSTGNIQIATTALSLGHRGTFSVVKINTVNFLGGTIYHYRCTIPSGELIGTFALRGPTSFIYSSRYSGGNIIVDIASSSSNTSAHTIYWFTPMGAATKKDDTTYGMEVFSGTSDLVFSTSNNYLKVLGIFNHTRKGWGAFGGYSFSAEPGKVVATIPAQSPMYVHDYKPHIGITDLGRVAPSHSGNTVSLSKMIHGSFPLEPGVDGPDPDSWTQSMSCLFIDVTGL